MMSTATKDPVPIKEHTLPLLLDLNKYRRLIFLKTLEIGPFRKHCFPTLAHPAPDEMPLGIAMHAVLLVMRVAIATTLLSFLTNQDMGRAAEVI